MHVPLPCALPLVQLAARESELAEAQKALAQLRAANADHEQGMAALAAKEEDIHNEMAQMEVPPFLASLQLYRATEKAFSARRGGYPWC